MQLFDTKCERQKNNPGSRAQDSLDIPADYEEEDETEEDETAGHDPAADAVEERLLRADFSAMAVFVACSADG
jgi:hypothetical protein